MGLRRPTLNKLTSIMQGNSPLCCREGLLTRILSSRDGVQRKSSSVLPLPRLNYRAIIENPLSNQENARKRRSNVADDTAWTVLHLHRESIKLQRLLNDKRHQQGLIGAQVRVTKSASDKEELVEQAKALKDEIHSLEARVTSIDAKVFAAANSLPNDTHPSTPVGPESAAVIISTHGPPPMDPSISRDHMKIGRALDWIDLESGASVTGSSWYYLRNECALLELALTNYAMSVAVQAGYTPIIAPDVVKSDIANRCGFHPRDEDGVSQNYHLREQGTEASLILSGTAEIPLAGMFAQRTFNENELPLKVVGLGHAFRAEAGARGVDTRGLYRVHQFTKVELFALSRQEESGGMMKEMIGLQQQIFGGLGIPFRCAIVLTSFATLTSMYQSVGNAFRGIGRQCIPEV